MSGLSRLIANAGRLLAGNTVASVLGFASLVLMARALGPEALGLLALIQAYATTAGVVFQFQSWHAVVKYGAEALEGGEVGEFESLIRFGTLLDLGSALLGAGIAAAVALAVGSWFSWDEATSRLAAAFCITIAVDWGGTPKAVLRLFDRFDALARVQVISAAVKLVAVGAAVVLDASFAVFVLISGLAVVVGHALVIAYAWRELRARGHGAALRGPLLEESRRRPGLLRFVFATHLSGSLGIVTRELDLLIVGGLLGPAAAGLYRVAKQFAAVLSRPFEALYHAVYPELARLWAAGERAAFRGLVLRGGALAGAVAFAVWAGLWGFGEALLRLTVGPEFVVAYGVLLWFAASVVVGVASFALEPAGYSMGRARAMLLAHAFATALYLGLLVVLVLRLGLVGAGVAAVAFQLVWAAAMLFAQRKRG